MQKFCTLTFMDLGRDDPELKFAGASYFSRFPEIREGRYLAPHPFQDNFLHPSKSSGTHGSTLRLPTEMINRFLMSCGDRNPSGYPVRLIK